MEGMSNPMDGMYINGSMVCLSPTRTKSVGIFYGENPFHHASPVFMSQVVLTSLSTAFFQYLLTPLGQTAFISQTLGGLIMGPSFLGTIKIFRDTFFPVVSFYVCETIAYFGLMLFLFLVGVKTDLHILKKSGKRAVVIGLCSFFSPVVFNGILAWLMHHFLQLDPAFENSLGWLATFPCLSTFYVIVCLLGDLKLLNSELGRLAVSASMITGTLSYMWSLFCFSSSAGTKTGKIQMMLIMALVFAFMILVIAFILRPVMLWMIRKTGEEKMVKESYIFSIFVMILGCSMTSELVGQNYLLGPVILGMAVPEGPPLGSALVHRIESFVTSILLPIYFVVTGSNINLSIIHFKTVVMVELFVVSGIIWKVLGAMVPSLFCKMSVNDSISLALIMSVQGITEVLVISKAAELKYIDKESYSILVISLVFFTAIISPIVKYIYKPSKRYITYKRRTIQHTKPGTGLRMLACIYHDDHTPCIINLLEASNPSSNSPISFYLLHLMDLFGRSAPLLVVHKLGKSNSFNSNYSQHIIKAFRLYEEQNAGTVTVNPFTALSPYSTMHDEVCALALDKKVSLIIVPFHKFLTIHGAEESANAIRIVNKNILRMAPCSVGILVDRGTLGSTTSKLTNETSYNIAVIFLGGHDDRESLAYANRMVKHPNVNLTVYRLIEGHTKEYRMNVEMEKDFNFINEFRTLNARNERCAYKEEMVNDSVGMVTTIRTIENDFDLIMVGRRHNTDDSDLLIGLREWNEYPELGFIGDMLASADSSCKVSVLVIQQQNFVGTDVLVDSPRSTIVVGDSTIVDIPRDSRVHPLPPHRNYD